MQIISKLMIFDHQFNVPNSNNDDRFNIHIKLGSAGILINPKWAVIWSKKVMVFFGCSF